MSNLKLRSFPAITIDSRKLKYNLEQIKFILEQKQITAHYLTTGIAAYPPIIEMMADCGIEQFADSSLENLRLIRPYAKSVMLSRIPKISEASRVVEEVDLSVNSELETIFALSDAAVVSHKKHGIILMLEMGDLAEGFLAEDIINTVHQVLNLRGITLKGIRFNLNTFSGVKTDLAAIQRFAALAEEIRQSFDIELDYISGGNSGTLSLLKNPDFPQNINHLILGQAWLLGKENNEQHRIADLHQDIFTLYAEVVENKRKESMPKGEPGLNYAGRQLTFEDIGLIRRVILALGSQDVDFSGLTIREKGIEFIGSTLDYSIFNVSKYNHEIRVGDSLEFYPDYVALNRLFNSQRIEKLII